MRADQPSPYGLINDFPGGEWTLNGPEDPECGSVVCHIIARFIPLEPCIKSAGTRTLSMRRRAMPGQRQH